MSARIVIRPATLADVPWLLEECRAFDRFSDVGFSLVPDDTGLASATLAALIASCVFYVAVQVADGEEATETGIGFIAGVLHPHPFNPTLRVLSELLWWVNPAHRGTTAGGRLLGVFESYGQQHADLVVMTLETASPIMPQSLTRRGYVPRETSYVMATGRV